jgi:hypothetical protein
VPRVFFCVCLCGGEDKGLNPEREREIYLCVCVCARARFFFFFRFCALNGFCLEIVFCCMYCIPFPFDINSEERYGRLSKSFELNPLYYYVCPQAESLFQLSFCNPHIKHPTK